MAGPHADAAAAAGLEAPEGPQADQAAAEHAEEVAAPPAGDLSTTLRWDLTAHGAAADHDRLMATIHAASVAERQAVIADSALRDLIRHQLGAATAHVVFASLLEGSQKWQNPYNEFFAFVMIQDCAGALPDTATMSCWESIVYAALLAHQVTGEWVQQFYSTAFQAGDANAAALAQLGFSTALPTYAPPAASGTHGGVGAASSGNTRIPSAGQLLFYLTPGEAVPDHVAVSLGGDQAISLWNKPNHVDAVQRIHVTDLPGTVHVGTPPWGA